MSMTRPQPFEIHVGDEALEDLHFRLDRIIWPDEIAESGWDYGTPLAFMRDLVTHWRGRFDWRAVEGRINRFQNYRLQVNGLNVHAVHQPGVGPAPIPLLLMHGWPSTFYEMLDLATLLADPGAHGGDPRDAFDVVVPSLPGHGFSDRPSRPGFEDRQAGRICAELMRAFGYDRFGAHAYDLGASVMGLLCLDQPERVIGYHTTSPGNPSPGVGLDTHDLSDAERAYLAYLAEWGREEWGYGHILGTRPQTVAYGLHDSPTALAAWIVEKWRAWTVPPGGDVLDHFSKDQLLATVMIYWLTGTMNAANRYYYEGRHTRWPQPGEQTPVPLGVALTATQRFEQPPQEYVARMFPDIRRWVQLPRGGHFVAMEEPELLAEQIRAFFRPLR